MSDPTPTDPAALLTPAAARFTTRVARRASAALSGDDERGYYEAGHRWATRGLLVGVDNDPDTVWAFEAQGVPSSLAHEAAFRAGWAAGTAFINEGPGSDL